MTTPSGESYGTELGWIALVNSLASNWSIFVEMEACPFREQKMGAHGNCRSTSHPFWRLSLPCSTPLPLLLLSAVPANMGMGSCGQGGSSKEKDSVCLKRQPLGDRLTNWLSDLSSLIPMSLNRFFYRLIVIHLHCESNISERKPFPQILVWRGTARLIFSPLHLLPPSQGKERWLLYVHSRRHVKSGPGLVEALTLSPLRHSTHPSSSLPSFSLLTSSSNSTVHYRWHLWVLCLFWACGALILLAWRRLWPPFLLLAHSLGAGCQDKAIDVSKSVFKKLDELKMGVLEGDGLHFVSWSRVALAVINCWVLLILLPPSPLSVSSMPKQRSFQVTDSLPRFFVTLQTAQKVQGYKFSWSHLALSMGWETLSSLHLFPNLKLSSPSK